jgi:hypothetical protein
LYILHRHPESKWITFPLIVDWIIHSSAKKRKDYIPKELFRGLLAGNPEPNVLEGNDIKSNVAFRRNLTSIIDRARLKKAEVILAAYAWYLPANYSLDSFTAQSLDYGQQIYATELYGLPEHVAAGLKVHEDITHELSVTYNTKWIDINSIIPKNASNFNDVCHLTDEACVLLSRELSRTIDDINN